jgi:DNA invertase Pin-like site-specific DNA recombinase
MLIGYARVPTDEQSLDLQFDALKRARSRRVFTDKVSNTKADHPGLADDISDLRERDVLVIWTLDRLGRTMKGLMAPREVAQSLSVSIPTLYRWLPASSR